MNLIERLRDLAGNSTVGGNTMSAFNEAADEVERCWAEIEHKDAVLNARSVDLDRCHMAIAERDAEIDRLKAAKDEEALAAAHADGFQHGYRIATATLWPVVGTLLKDHHHG